MPPASAVPSIPSKRSRDAATLSTSKHRRQYHHDHRPKNKQETDSNGTVIFPDESMIQKQLERAISLVLKAVGFNGADPVALSSFRLLVEEYMIQFLEAVQISMIASRRVQPLPEDFLVALNKKNLTLQSLLIHLDPPVRPEDSQPALQAERDENEADEHDSQLIHRLLSQTTLNSEPYVPRKFPSLPSRHTFRAEAVFAAAYRDQKQIRELATEEGRLGEEALRRLMSKKASGDDALLTNLRAGSRLAVRQRSRALWRETYDEAVSLSQAQAMEVDGQKPDTELASHLRPAVNADSVYWRKPITRKITENGSTEN